MFAYVILIFRYIYSFLFSVVVVVVVVINASHRPLQLFVVFLFLLNPWFWNSFVCSFVYSCFRCCCFRCIALNSSSLLLLHFVIWSLLYLNLPQLTKHSFFLFFIFFSLLLLMLLLLLHFYLWLFYIVLVCLAGWLAVEFVYSSRIKLHAGAAKT